MSTAITEALHRLEAQGLHIRAHNDKTGRFTARALTYDVVDSYGTEFAPGTFTASLRNRLPRLTWNHDWADVIGVATRIDRDDDTALDVEFQLDDFASVPRAAQANAQIKS